MRAYKLERLNARTVKDHNVIGVKAEEEGPPPSYPIQHCPLCGAATVLAWDGDCEENELTKMHSRIFDFDPLPTEERWRGDAVLWFAVDSSNRPVEGRQRFTRVFAINGDYTGQLWKYHRLTCGKQQQTIPGVA